MNKKDASAMSFLTSCSTYGNDGTWLVKVVVEE